MTNQASRIIVVTGMHRSGTSLLGNILRCLGVDFGTRLIQADQNNQAGYFEHAEIVRLHADLLMMLDRRWVGKKGTLSYPERWWEHAEVLEIREQLVRIVKKEIGTTDQLWGFKDPRISRLLPMWKTIFSELNIDPVYYLTVRHPQAVTESIKKRDELSTSHAQLLWLQHNLSFLEETRDEPIHIIVYERWFNDLSHQIDQVADSLVKAGTTVAMAEIAAAKRVIDPELRHHVPEFCDCIPLVDELYLHLAQASLTGTLSKRIWEINQTFNISKGVMKNWSDIIDKMPSRVIQSPDLRPNPTGWVSKFLRRLSSK